MRRLNLLIVGFFIILFLLSTFHASSSEAPQGEKSKWVAPTWADTLKNSFDKDPAAWKEGKQIYSQLCFVCHGNKGKGDGIAGGSLKPRPTDLTSEQFQKQSDGAIFWKITAGNPPMASYKEVLSEEKRWKLVNFIRELGKK